MTDDENLGPMRLAVASSILALAVAAFAIWLLRGVWLR